MHVWASFRQHQTCQDQFFSALTLAVPFYIFCVCQDYNSFVRHNLEHVTLFWTLSCLSEVLLCKVQIRFFFFCQ